MFYVEFLKSTLFPMQIPEQKQSLHSILFIGIRAEYATNFFLSFLVVEISSTVHSGIRDTPPKKKILEMGLNS